MSFHDDFWDSLGVDHEAEESRNAYRAVRQATLGPWRQVMASSDEADFANRCSLVEPTIAKVAAEVSEIPEETTAKVLAAFRSDWDALRSQAEAEERARAVSQRVGSLERSAGRWISPWEQMSTLALSELPEGAGRRMAAEHGGDGIVGTGWSHVDEADGFGQTPIGDEAWDADPWPGGEQEADEHLDFERKGAVALSHTRARKLAGDWHGGQTSPLYAFASSGYLHPDLESEITQNLSQVHQAITDTKHHAHGSYRLKDARDLQSLLHYVRKQRPNGWDTWSGDDQASHVRSTYRPAQRYQGAERSAAWEGDSTDDEKAGEDWHEELAHAEGRKPKDAQEVTDRNEEIARLKGQEDHLKKAEGARRTASMRDHLLADHGATPGSLSADPYEWGQVHEWAHANENPDHGHDSGGRTVKREGARRPGARRTAHAPASGRLDYQLHEIPEEHLDDEELQHHLMNGHGLSAGTYRDSNERTHDRAHQPGWVSGVDGSPSGAQHTHGGTMYGDFYNRTASRRDRPKAEAPSGAARTGARQVTAERGKSTCARCGEPITYNPESGEWLDRGGYEGAYRGSEAENHNHGPDDDYYTRTAAQEGDEPSGGGDSADRSRPRRLSGLWRRLVSAPTDIPQRPAPYGGASNPFVPSTTSAAPPPPPRAPAGPPQVRSAPPAAPGAEAMTPQEDMSTPSNLQPVSARLSKVGEVAAEVLADDPSIPVHEAVHLASAVISQFPSVVTGKAHTGSYGSFNFGSLSQADIDGLGLEECPQCQREAFSHPLNQCLLCNYYDADPELTRPASHAAPANPWVDPLAK